MRGVRKSRYREATRTLQSAAYRAEAAGLLKKLLALSYINSRERRIAIACCDHRFPFLRPAVGKIHPTPPFTKPF